MINTHIKPIRTEADYEAALFRIEELMDAKANTPEFDELEVLTTLVESYEDQNYTINAPNPVAAIKFRMEQQDLKQSDLISYIGSKSKVSEVLSGKRELSKKMIRALHEGLNIPLSSLFQESPKLTSALLLDNWDSSKFPLKEMAKKGWIEQRNDLSDYAEEIIQAFIKPADNINILSSCLYRRSSTDEDKADKYALFAWGVELIKRTKDYPLKTKYQPGTINQDFIKKIISFSPQERGVVLAKEFLASHGIHLVYLPHLSKTYLDGVSLRLFDGTPVIGMTIRHDRIDNFWFTLCHELAHHQLHLEEENTNRVFFDNLDSLEDNDFEREADEYATNLLIPSEIWDAENLVGTVLKDGEINYKDLNYKIKKIANSLDINPAIVVGRIRKESGNYKILSKRVGQGKVKELLEV